MRLAAWLPLIVSGSKAGTGPLLCSHGCIGPGLASVYQLMKSADGGVTAGAPQVEFGQTLSTDVHGVGGAWSGLVRYLQPPSTLMLVSGRAAVPRLVEGWLRYARPRTTMSTAGSPA